MSFRHPDDYIRNAPYDDPTIILVLVVMGQSADAENNKLWPKVSTLAKWCRISERRMREIMNILIADGFVERVYRRASSNANLSNMYRMYLTEEAATRKAQGITDTADEYGDPSQGEGATHRRGRVRPIAGGGCDPSQGGGCDPSQPESPIENPHMNPHLNSLARSAENAPQDGRAERARQRVFEQDALKRDPLYGAFARALNFQPETRQMWDEWRIGLNELNRLHATAQEVHHAIDAFYSRYPQATCTVRAIVKWWPALKEGKSHDIAKLEAAQRSAALTRTAQREQADANRRAGQAELAKLYAELGITDPAGASNAGDRR